MDGADQIFQGPDGTALRFYHEPTKNNFQSEKQGMPIFDTSLMCEVMVPGSRESTPKFEVERVYHEAAGLDGAGNRLTQRTEKYVQYQEQINAFKLQNGEGVVSGTPIGQWANIDAGTAATLKAQGIYTVEMLAGVHDGNLANLGTGGRVLRDQAQAFINTRQFGVPSAKMAAESAQFREEIVRLNGAVSDLTTRLSAALAENAALRQGQQPPIPAPGGPQTVALDPMSNTTISQPNPFATLDSGSASPLTPTEGQADEQAKQAAQNTQEGLVRVDQQPNPFPPPQEGPRTI